MSLIDMKNQAGMNPITEDDIANYLGNNPDFFERHAQVLASVTPATRAAYIALLGG
mgnify:CR=1 FL=1